MKILYLTSRFPYPPYRGDKLRNWTWLKSLSQKHDIILVTFIASQEEMQLVSQLQEICSKVHVVYLPKWKSMLNCIKAFWKRVPFQVAYYESERMRSLVEQLVVSEKPDLLHTHLLRMMQYTEHYKSIPSVLDMVDAVSVYIERFKNTTKNPFIRKFLSSELSRMKEYKIKISTYDRIFVCSEPDLKLIKKAVPQANIDVLDNGVDTDYFCPDSSMKVDPYRLIFTGNMAYYPNADGAKYFVENILPIIHKSIPQVNLFIVGQSPPMSVRKLANRFVKVTGFVSDIRAEYLQSCLAVSPIRFGSGTLNKVLEPMALGVPVVATNIGVDGLGVQSGVEILIAHNPHEFAEQVVRLLNDPELRKKISDAALRVVQNRFGWKRITEKLCLIEEEIATINKM